MIFRAGSRPSCLFTAPELRSRTAINRPVLQPEDGIKDRAVEATATGVLDPKDLHVSIAPRIRTTVVSVELTSARLGRSYHCGRAAGTPAQKPHLQRLELPRAPTLKLRIQNDTSGSAKRHWPHGGDDRASVHARSSWASSSTAFASYSAAIAKASPSSCGRLPPGQGGSSVGLGSEAR